MKAWTFSDAQMELNLKQGYEGPVVAGICRKAGISE